MKSSQPNKPARRKTPANTGQIRQKNKLSVLLGRGKGCTSSKGNQRYLSLIEKYAPAYVQAKSRKEQNDVKLAIIREVREYGGHFLQPVPGSNESQWEEAPLETVLNKIAQSLRYHIRKGKVMPSDDERVSPHDLQQPQQQQPLDFQADFGPTSPLTMQAMKPTDIWTSGFQMNHHQQQQQQHQQPQTAQLSMSQQAFAGQSNLLEDRSLQLPTIVTPPQQQQYQQPQQQVPQMTGAGGGGFEDFGMFSNEFLRKVAFFGRVHQDDPSNAMEV